MPSRTGLGSDPEFIEPPRPIQLAVIFDFHLLLSDFWFNAVPKEIELSHVPAGELNLYLVVGLVRAHEHCLNMGLQQPCGVLL